MNSLRFTALLLALAFASLAPASSSVVPVGGGFVQVKPDLFPSDFAADVPRFTEQFMAISQVPISASIFDSRATVAARSSKPSYAVIATEDRMINPRLEQFMSDRAKSQAIKLRGSHAIFLSHPKEVASPDRESREGGRPIAFFAVENPLVRKSRRVL